MPKQVKKTVKKPVKKAAKKTSTQTTKKTVKAVKKPQAKKVAKVAPKAPVAVVAPVVVPAPVFLPEKTLAEKIWDNIKDKAIDMFALPGQTPAKYCKPVVVEPSKLYLKFTVSAVLPALEEAFKSVYNVELVDKYIVLSVKPEVAKK